MATDVQLTPEQEAIRQQMMAGVRLVNGRPLPDPEAAAARAKGRPKIEVALALAKRGFKVFPVTAGAKAPPLIHDWPAKATSDPDTIRGWWNTLGADSNPAIHCEGFLVIDVDTKNGGDESLAALRAEHDLPQTMRVRTPSGGQHLFYRLPSGHPGVSNSHGLLGPGLDVRSTNGYTVAPGATTPAGRYRIELDAPIADAPEWLIEAARMAPQRERTAAVAVPDADEETMGRAVAWLETAEPAIQGRGGDGLTYLTAAHLRDLGLSQRQALEAMLFAWNDRCSPPWEPEELAVKVGNAYRYAKNEPGTSVARLEDFPEVPVEAAATADEDFGAPVTGLAALLAGPDTPADGLAVLLAGPDTPPAGPRPRGPRKLADFAAADAGGHGYLVKGLLQRASYGLMYGTPGSGKTFVALDLAYHVAAGLEWHGRRVRQGPVLYLAYEGAGGLRHRATALREHYGRDADVPLYFDDTPYNLRDKAGRQALGAALRELPAPPALIIIDTLAHALCGGDENSAQDVGAFNSGVQALIRHTGAHVLVVHHPGKNAANGARGSSALLGAVDTELEVANRQLRPTKQRDIELGEPIGFKLVPVAVGVDEDGDVLSSCVVEPAPIPPPPAATRLRAGSLPSLAYDALKEMSPANDPVAEADWRQACAEFLPGSQREQGRRWAEIKQRLRLARLIVADDDGRFMRRME